jgi:flagellar basal body-associated protein FliL
MKNNENVGSKEQRFRLVLLIIMSVVVFGTAAMIITALLTLSDLRNDVKQMNQQMDVYQKDAVK